MCDIIKIRNIAEYLGFDNIVSELELIDARSKQENANLILPLVGEFNSGKTTLINALTDSKKLETATRPTTATIYEVHFGCDCCHAEVVTENGTLQDVNDIADLKNDFLADAKVVTIFDTSKRVPSTTILVDTPGLSSPHPKHKQTLVNFLPKADGILLVIDINQQITRSLTDFLDTMKLSNKPIYLVLTKSDTKFGNDIDTAKRYISENSKVPFQQIAVVSAETNTLDEIYVLFDSIQRNKKQIIKRIDNQRISNIVKLLTEHIETLMNNSSDKDLDEAIRYSQYELDKISQNVDLLVESISNDIKAQETTTIKRFEDIILEKLISLVNSKSDNFDADAVSTINSTATLLMNDYRNGILSIIRENANRQKNSENKVPLNSLRDIDLSDCQITGLSYNLNLNTMGHEYDAYIKIGVIAVASVAAVAATGGGAATVATLATADNVIDIADTVTDVGSMISNPNSTSKIERAVGFASSAADRYQMISQSNQQMGEQIGSNKGLVESVVGLVTDRMMSKPQRRHAIKSYIDLSLTSEFKIRLHAVSQQVVETIRTTLYNEANQIIEQKKKSLNQLKKEFEKNKSLFDQRMEQLREFKTNLLTFNMK